LVQLKAKKDIFKSCFIEQQKYPFHGSVQAGWKSEMQMKSRKAFFENPSEVEKYPCKAVYFKAIDLALQVVEWEMERYFQQLKLEAIEFGTFKPLQENIKELKRKEIVDITASTICNFIGMTFKKKIKGLKQTNKCKNGVAIKSTTIIF
jgi:hypothetical protein